MDDENVANRLKLFMNELGVNSSQFADTCGIARPNLSQFLTGRNKKVNNIFLSLVHKAYPDLSIGWLLFGEGDMMNTNDSENNNNGSLKSEFLSVGQDVQQYGIDSQMPVYGEILGAETVVNNRKFSNYGEVSDSKNSEFMSDESDDSKFLNYRALNKGQNMVQRPSAQELNLSLKIHELEDEIEKLRRYPRKVTRITIYYDDSTFETFLPEDIIKD